MSRAASGRWGSCTPSSLAQSYLVSLPTVLTLGAHGGTTGRRELDPAGGEAVRRVVTWTPSPSCPTTPTHRPPGAPAALPRR